MSFWQLGSALIVLIVGAAAASKSDTPGTNGGGGRLPESNPAPAPGPAETAACEAIALARPAEYLGRTRPPGMSDADWFARVAYWQTYPDAPPDPAADDPVFGAALARLRACIAARLGQIVLVPIPDPAPDPAPNPAPPPKDNGGGIGLPPQQQLPQVSEIPLPGRYYQIQNGDTLRGVASAAYGTGPGTSANFGRMVLINDAPFNQRFVRADAADSLFPDGRISFNPRFGKTWGAQYNDPQKGGEVGAGGSYATIFIPPVP